MDVEELDERLAIAEARSAAHADAFTALAFTLVEVRAIDPQKLRHWIESMADDARSFNRHPEWPAELRRIAADLPLTAPPPPRR